MDQNYCNMSHKRVTVQGSTYLFEVMSQKVTFSQPKFRMNRAIYFSQFL